MERLEDIMKLIEDRIVDKVGKLLDEKGALAGNITRTALRQTMQEIYEEGRRAGAVTQPRCDVVEVDIDDDPEYKTWPDGSLHRLPYGYILTRLGTASSCKRSETARAAYLRWNIADRARRICAIR